MRIDELFAGTQGETLYVSRPLINPQALINWATAQGLPSCLKPGDFHVTIAYSKTPVDWRQTAPISDQLRIEGGPRSLDRLGEAIVLRLQCDELRARWQALIDIGCTWDYPAYKPHVTITYQSNGFDYQKLTPYRGALVFGSERFAPVRRNYQDDIAEMRLSENPRRDQARA